MKYVSTRGSNEQLQFLDILLAGLAPDGGLYLPVAYPKVCTEQLDQWRNV
jgi:threonine synthase